MFVVRKIYTRLMPILPIVVLNLMSFFAKSMSVKLILLTFITYAKNLY